jgi:hypothetical protein
MHDLTLAALAAAAGLPPDEVARRARVRGLRGRPPRLDGYTPRHGAR